MAKWKFQQIEPQPARGTLQDFMWDSRDWIAEEKFDGDRRIAQFCGDTIRFTGRKKSVKDGLFVEKTANIPHLSGLPSKNKAVPSFGPRKGLEGTVLDGEIICGEDTLKLLAAQGGLSKYVTSIMGSLPAEAVAKQIARGWLRYAVFDVLFYKHKDMRDARPRHRHALLEDIVCHQWNNPFATVAVQYPSSKKSAYEEIISRGGEGVVLKRLDHEYGDKNGWVKVKKQATADCVIMGFKAAKEMSEKVDGTVSMTKYAAEGLIGAVVVGQYSNLGTLEEVATISGMDDDLRRKLTAQQERHVGRVVRILHNGREPSGRFRHPRWDDFRTDKLPRACIMVPEEV